MSHHWLTHHNLFWNWSSEVPKTSKNSFSTSPVDTRNTSFERSTANLGILIVALLIVATQSFLKLKFWGSQNLPRHSFPQALWPQETQLLKVLTPILAIEMSHHWLMHHNLFWNWSSEDPKTSKNSFFYKVSGHKKHRFWMVHRQSWKLEKCKM